MYLCLLKRIHTSFLTEVIGCYVAEISYGMVICHVILGAEMALGVINKVNSLVWLHGFLSICVHN